MAGRLPLGIVAGVRWGARGFTDGSSPMTGMEEREKLRAKVGEDYARGVLRREEKPLETLERAYQKQGISPSEREVAQLLDLLGDADGVEGALHLMRELKKRLGVEPSARIVGDIARKLEAKGRLKTTEKFLLIAEEEFGVIPDERTIRHLVGQYAKKYRFRLAVNLVDSAWERYGFKPEGRLFDLVIYFMARKGYVERALDVLQDMQEKYDLRPTEATLGGVMAGYRRMGRPDEAVELMESMQERYGVTPNIRHFHDVVRAFTLSGRADKALNLVFEAEERFGMTPNHHCLSSLVLAYAATNRIAKAEEIVATFLEREWATSNCCNSILANAHLRFGDEAKGYELAKDCEMERPLCYTLVQKAAEKSKLREVRRLFKEMQERGIALTPVCWVWKMEAAHSARGDAGVDEVLDEMEQRRVVPSNFIKSRAKELKRKMLPRKRYNRLTPAELKDRNAVLHGIKVEERTDDDDAYFDERLEVIRRGGQEHYP